MITSIKLNITIIIISMFAFFISPLSMEKYIRRGIVCVCPGIFPATIRVAPNSPMARIHERRIPASIPFEAIGKIMYLNI